MRILISGAGIAGGCLAYWLSRYGFEPTLVEQAPALRTGGYIVDFWGAGFDVAERMGIAPEVLAAGYKMQEVRQVDRNGRRVGGFPVRAFDRMTHGRYTSLPRSDLAAAIFHKCERVETIFADRIAALEDTGDGVRVRFEGGTERAFDLVLGADGLHSRVRELVFGPEPRFEKFLQMKIAAFEAKGYPARDELAYVIHREVGKQVGRFAMRDDQTMFLFVFADDDPKVPSDARGQEAVLRREFANAGWECPAILDALQATSGLYMDRVSQIRLDQWTRGRVALVGDAAFCLSFLAGQGSALAMVAAYVLAGELARARGDHASAFARYEARLRDLVASKQKAARKYESFFAPRSRLGMFVGDQLTKLMSIPYVAEIGVGRELRDRIALQPPVR